MSTMKSTQTVYYGPSISTYPSMGSVSNMENVTALWKEGTWTYIKYSVSGTSNYKCGYVPTNTVTIAETVSTKTLSSSTRYVNTASTVYLGPGSSGYASGGSVSLGETVSYLGYKSNNYAYIMYSISGSSQKKRAYIYANYLTTTPVTSSIDTQVGSILANLSNTSYYGLTNCSGRFSKPQCTWYCWGRAKEKTGKSLTFTGSANGYQWYDHINTSNITKRAASLGPVKNSIASFRGGSQGYGHVIFVEDVANGYTYFTEFNYKTSKNGVLQKIATSSFATFRSGFTLNGYIVL